MWSFLEIESAPLLKLDNDQTRIERVEFADLNVGAVQVNRGVVLKGCFDKPGDIVGYCPTVVYDEGNLI